MAIETWIEQIKQAPQRLLYRIFSKMDAIYMPEWSVIMGMALIIGVGAGFGAVIFRELIAQAQTLFFGSGERIFAFLGDYYIVIIPALGGLIVGPLVYFFAREAKGHGVPEVMEAVALKGGRIRPRVAVVKSLASSVNIGSGGSVGREGPIVQIGSALGSTLGQWLKLSDDRVRTLVACGAAGGIAATFNTPIAGAIFALEIILGELHASYFGAVVISAVVADVVAHIFEGSVRAFPVPNYELTNPWELFLYAGLGVLAAIVGVVYSKLIYRGEDLFDAWKRFPEYLKPVIGGLLLGLMGVLCVALKLTINQESGAFPQIYGVGYETIETTLLGDLAVGTTLVLLLLKLVATAITLGSGGSGGVFAPALFLGAMLGSSFGQVVHGLLPNTTAPSGAYALVGMGAVFAAAAHAPATAILILFEMTGDYHIILPLMLATVISIIIARAIEPESVYTFKLSRRGVRIQQGRDVDVMETVKVEEVMTRNVDTVPGHLSLLDLMAEFERTHHHGFPVIDHAGDLLGIVTLQDLEIAMESPGWDLRKVEDIASCNNLLIAYPDEPVGAALRRLSIRDVGRLPVVTRENDRELIGVVRRQDIVRAYNMALLARVDRKMRASQHAAHRHTHHFVECTISPESSAVGKSIRDLTLPHDSVLVNVHRGSAQLIPHGDTVLQVGDHITAYVSDADRASLLECLHPGSASDQSAAQQPDAPAQT